MRLPERFWTHLRFRRAFRRAIPEPALWCWRVPGVRALRRLERWWAGERALLEAEARRARWAAAEAEWNAGREGAPVIPFPPPPSLLRAA